MKMWISKYGRYAILAIFILLFSLPLIWKSIYPLPKGSYVLRFSKSLWDEPVDTCEPLDEAISAKYQTYTCRQLMLGYLVKNELSGKSRSEIVDLLGNDFYWKLGSDHSVITYYTGPNRTSVWGFDEAIRIHFHPNEAYSHWDLIVD